MDKLNIFIVFSLILIALCIQTSSGTSSIYGRSPKAFDLEDAVNPEQRNKRCEECEEEDGSVGTVHKASGGERPQSPAGKPPPPGGKPPPPHPPGGMGDMSSPFGPPGERVFPPPHPPPGGGSGIRCQCDCDGLPLF